MCIFRFLPSILSKSPFQLKRKKSQELGSQSATSKNGAPYIFLNELCESYDLPKSGSKHEVMERLIKYYFFHAEHVPASVIEQFPKGEWQKASRKDSSIQKEIDELCENLAVETDPIMNDDNDENSSNERVHQPFTGTLAVSHFPISMLAAVYHAKKLRLFPESDTIFFCNHEFTTDLINQSLAAFDTSPWDAQPFGQETPVVQRRTIKCALRLFVLLLVDDAFFERLVNESAAGPSNRDDLDVSAVGDNSNLWVDVCEAYKNDAYTIPEIPVRHRFFVDPGTNELYNISRCSSTWVNPGKLRKWYNTAHNALVMYRTKYDRSGNHDFNSEEGLEEFVSKFAHGNRDCCFLAALANWRGDDALEWFSADLPQNIEVVDGFEESPMPIDTMSEYSRDDSKFTRDEGRELDRLVNALKNSSDSPEKRAYFQQKAKLLQVEQQDKKRKSNLTLARELRHECKGMDSDDDEDRILKKRMKLASRRIFARILDEVEGETEGEMEAETVVPLTTEEPLEE
jgi:hypothetical protein